MLDPFPAAPPALLVKLVTPLADKLSLPTLPLHAHEIIFAVVLYQGIASYLSPAVSSRLFPRTYPALSPRTKLNWDVHVVSLVQSLFINALALWVIAYDEERSRMDWRGRVWGYTGASGLVQGLAAGYFLWDLIITTRHVDIFGWGMWAHAVCALCVFACGFRPFVNYYGPIFILYELSSPFLNIHWFFDKLGMTGSRAQLYNGLVLLATFFGCRLVWGTMQTYFVFWDVWSAIYTQSPYPDSPTKLSPQDLAANASNPALQQSHYGDAGSVRYAGPHVVPMWLGLLYLAANSLLTALNFYWFNKMIEAVRKRFRPAGQRQKKEGARGIDGAAKAGKAVEGGDAEEDGHVRAPHSEDDLLDVKTLGGHGVEVLSSTTTPLNNSTANSSRQRRRYG